MFVVQNAKDRYYTTVYLWCFSPIFASFLIFAVLVIRLAFAYSKHAVSQLSNNTKSTKRTSSFIEENGEAKRGKEPETFGAIKQRMIAQHVYIALLLSYLVLPPVAVSSTFSPVICSQYLFCNLSCFCISLVETFSVFGLHSLQS